MKPLIYDLKKKTNGKLEPQVKTIKGLKPESFVLERTLLRILQNQSIEKICRELNCTKGAIENHVVKLVEYGKLNVHRFINIQRYDTIMEVYNQYGTSPLKELINLLPDGYTYFEMNLVKADLERIKHPIN